jgi:hypothetical protein
MGAPELDQYDDNFRRCATPQTLHLLLDVVLGVLALMGMIAAAVALRPARRRRYAPRNPWGTRR